MTPNSKVPATIDEYIADFPPNVQVILEKVRSLVREIVPEAQEAISYKMPAFKFHGNLVYFAAFKNHIGFYPMPHGIDVFKEELSKYASGKGSVQFPLNQPIPYDIITKIVEYRVAENLAKAKGKNKPAP